MAEDNLSGLKHMGASWFVSFMYFDTIDESHDNWQKAGSLQMRLRYYTNGRRFHKEWLEYVISMKPVYLNRNTIDLTAEKIKEMAEILLKKLNDKENESV